MGSEPCYARPARSRGTLRYVFPQQQEIEMADGTLLSATMPHQLDQLQPGMSVRILAVDDGDRKEIQSIERVAQYRGLARRGG